MSITAVPISMRRVLAPMAASSGKGEASWRAKWWTRKYAPSAPSSSAATARSIDWSSASEADRVCDWGDGVQGPKDRNPMLFMQGQQGRSVDLPGRRDRRSGLVAEHRDDREDDGDGEDEAHDGQQRSHPGPALPVQG